MHLKRHFFDNLFEIPLRIVGSSEEEGEIMARHTVDEQRLNFIRGFLQAAIHNGEPSLYPLEFGMREKSMFPLKGDKRADIDLTGANMLRFDFCNSFK